GGIEEVRGAPPKKSIENSGKEQNSNNVHHFSSPLCNVVRLRTLLRWSVAGPEPESHCESDLRMFSVWLQNRVRHHTICSQVFWGAVRNTATRHDLREKIKFHVSFGTHDVVILKPNKDDLGSPALGQGVYRLKDSSITIAFDDIPEEGLNSPLRTEKVAN
ncbi:hypothetical protein M8C21_003330, partial [Ambrosia artemisiifolia]